MFKFDPLAKIRKWLTTSKDVSTEGKWFADAVAVKNIYDSLKWTYIGENTGTNSVTFTASNYIELYIRVWNTESWLSLIIPTNILTTSVQRCIPTGGLYNSTLGSFAEVILTTSYARIGVVMLNQVDKSSSGKIVVYGR